MIIYFRETSADNIFAKASAERIRGPFTLLRAAIEVNHHRVQNALAIGNSVASLYFTALFLPIMEILSTFTIDNINPRRPPPPPIKYVHSLAH